MPVWLFRFRDRFLSCALAVVWLATCGAAASSLAAETSLRMNVAAGDTARHDCPVTVSLPETITGPEQDWVLTEVREGRRQPVAHQFRNRPGRTLAWILEGRTPAGTPRMFELRRAAPATNPPAVDPSRIVTTIADEQMIQIRHRDRPLLTYHIARVAAPEGADPRYGRSGHIHPVWTPGGHIVSDEFPPDHLHQDGIFLAFTKTEFQGRPVNFWELLGGSGWVRSGPIRERYAGPVCGGFRVELEHVARTTDDQLALALIEDWDVCAWNVADARGWRFDITSRIRCGTDAPLKIQQYHYGGMAFRGARGWTDKNSRFSTPENKSREAANHSRVPWVDLSGMTDGTWSGLTVFTDPANFRYPEPARLHPSMPYFVFTPAVLGDWAIEPGTIHTSRYHYWVHDAELDPATVERISHEYTRPPAVTVQLVTD